MASKTHDHIHRKPIVHTTLAAIRAGGAIAAICLAACGVESAEDTAPAETEQIVSQINRVAPAVEDASRLAAAVGQASFYTRNERMVVTIPASSAGRVELVRPGEEATSHVQVGLPLSDLEKAGVVTQDGTVVYPRALAATDVAVQVFDQGVRIQTVLNDATAPSEFPYAIALPDGQRLTQAESGGGMVIVDAQGTPRAGFAAPWAFDRNHQSVPTHYEVRGTALVQVIDHVGANLAYPIVADPYLWIDLIAGATWTGSKTVGKRTLSVTPTWWARANGGSAGGGVGALAWNELYSKFKNKGLNRNLGSMRNQLICHEIIAFLKPTWNLDEWRPDVGLLGTLAHACNP
jgi:hypothetical protein